jgi:hypothetical protein
MYFNTITQNNEESITYCITGTLTHSVQYAVKYFLHMHTNIIVTIQHRISSTIIAEHKKRGSGKSN